VGGWRLLRCYGVATALLGVVWLAVGVRWLAERDEFDDDVDLPARAFPPALLPQRLASVDSLLDTAERMEVELEREVHAKQPPRSVTAKP
jgi:hypothetical protein